MNDSQPTFTKLRRERRRKEDSLAIQHVQSLVGDKFKVLRRIGQGGMGEVYLVQHLRLEALRVVKFFWPHNDLQAQLAEDEIQQMCALFEQEGRKAARLSHPNIVRVHDANHDACGRPYIEYEYVDGRDLSAAIEANERLSYATVIEYGRQLLEGLVAIHDAGLLHRDLTPRNCMIETKTGKLKIIDFGISFDASRDALTFFGGNFGTPSYMAPELSSPGARLTDATDTWSAAVVFYELCTGRVAFQSSEEGRESFMHDLLVKKRCRAIPKVSSVRPDWPNVRVIDWFLATAMHPDQSRRFPTARAMLADFERLSQPLPMGVPDSSWELELPALEPEGDPLVPVPGTERLPNGGLVHKLLATIRLSRRPSHDRAGRFADTSPAQRSGPMTEPTPPPARDPMPSVPRPRRESGRMAKLILAGAISVALVTLTAVISLFGDSPWLDRGREANPWVYVPGAPRATVLGWDAPNMASGAPFFSKKRRVMAPQIGFYLQAHEVSEAEFASWKHGGVRSAGSGRGSRSPRADYPATGVTWYDAKAYCRELGGDLPTEEQFEWAARGPSLHRAPWGDDPLDRTRTRAALVDESALPGKIGQSQLDRTRSGIMDLIGNAPEWTSHPSFRHRERPHATADLAWARAVRGLPLRVTPKFRLPEAPAAFRVPICPDRSCEANRSRWVGQSFEVVGFRCARPEDGP